MKTRNITWREAKAWYKYSSLGRPQRGNLDEALRPSVAYIRRVGTGPRRPAYALMYLLNRQANDRECYCFLISGF